MLKSKKYDKATTAMEILQDVDLTEKTILITGTTNGIGKETARTLAIKGAHVIMANRNLKLSEELRAEIYKETVFRRINIIQMDLSSLESIKHGVEMFFWNKWPLHVLILNAGVSWTPDSTTKEGYEALFGVNHLGHFYLTHLLMDKLRESAPSRLVVVSSDLHAYTKIDPNSTIEEKLKKLIPSVEDAKLIDAMRFYCRSKLCNVLFAFKAHRSEHKNGINTYVLHPGIIPDSSLSRQFPLIMGIYRTLAKPFVNFKNFEQGAATTVYCAASLDVEYESGQYYVDCADAENELQKDLARDEELQDALWKKSLEFIKNFEKVN